MFDTVAFFVVQYRRTGALIDCPGICASPLPVLVAPGEVFYFAFLHLWRKVLPLVATVPNILGTTCQLVGMTYALVCTVAFPPLVGERSIGFRHFCRNVPTCGYDGFARLWSKCSPFKGMGRRLSSPARFHSAVFAWAWIAVSVSTAFLNASRSGGSASMTLKARSGMAPAMYSM